MTQKKWPSQSQSAPLTRRHFLTHTAASLALAGLPGVAHAAGVRPVDADRAALRLFAPGRGETDPEITALTAHALDAARQAGATYADVRYVVEAKFWYPLEGQVYRRPLQERYEWLGVRALYSGYWGGLGPTV